MDLYLLRGTHHELHRKVSNFPEQAGIGRAATHWHFILNLIQSVEMCLKTMKRGPSNWRVRD